MQGVPGRLKSTSTTYYVILHMHGIVDGIVQSSSYRKNERYVMTALYTKKQSSGTLLL